MLISIILCSIIYFTQNTPLRVGAVPSFGNDTDKPPTPRAFCVMENIEEVWKEIPGFDGRYLASNLGRIKSRKILKATKKISERILKPCISNGYHIVPIYKKSYRVHRLVALAFLPNPHCKPQINHINGVKTDNHAGNLEWCTPSENLLHACRVTKVKKGVGVKGEKNVSAVLKEDDVLALFDYLSKGGSISEFAKVRNTKLKRLRDVVHGKSWKYLNLDWSSVYKKTPGHGGYPSKPVLQYDKEMNFIKEFPSITAAAKKICIKDSAITNCCKGKRWVKTVRGFIFKYKTSNP